MISSFYVHMTAVTTNGRQVSVASDNSDIIMT